MVFTLALSGAAALAVTGSTTCPTAAAVSAQLEPLLAPSGPAAPATASAAGDVAELALEASGVRITLRRADGSIAGTRTLAGEHGCAELAEAAAVVIAAWENDTSVDRLPAPPRRPPPVRAAAVVATPSPTAIRWSIGAGAGAGWAGGELAPAAVVGASVAPAASRLGL